MQNPGGKHTVYKAADASEVISGTVSPEARELLATLTLNFTTDENQRVLVMLTATGYQHLSGSDNYYARILIDDVVKANVAEQSDTQYQNRNLSFCYVTDALSAGPHTAKFDFAKFSSAQPDWTLADAISMAIVLG